MKPCTPSPSVHSAASIQEGARRGVLTVTLAVFCAAPAFAVEKGGLGLDAEAGSRRLVGLTCHLSERVAVRPGVFFQRVVAEQVPTVIDAFQEPPVYETEETALGGRLEVDYFLRPKARLAPYVSASATYSQLNTPYPASPDGNLVLRNGTLRNSAVGAGFGAQYAVSGPFHVFGHVGLSYSNGQRFTLNGRKLRSHAWSTATSAVGVVLYLNDGKKD